MPKKKTEEEVVETAENSEATDNAAEETAVEAQADDSAETEAVEASAETEEKPKKDGKKKAEATEEKEESSIVDSVLETAASAVETAGEVAESVARTVGKGLATVVSAVSAVTGSSESEPKKTQHRAERIGIVSSDKMTKTVTVRVDRQIKHPIYRKYIKRRKKFMAHDEMGAGIGDKVRIVETRPLSAKKRWRVVEIIQKAEK